MAKGNPVVEIDITDTGVTTSQEVARLLLLGIKTVAGSLVVDTPTRVFSDSEGTDFAGEGSQLDQMILAARGQFSRVNLTIVALDAPAGAASQGVLTFGGAATTANPLILQIEDQIITVPVAIADAGANIATSAALEVAEFPKLHVAGTANLLTLELDALSFGEHGNLIRIRVVKIPDGVTAVVTTPMSGGSGAGDVGAALAALGAVRYDYIVLPDTNAVNLTAVIAELNARFTGKEAIDGHAFAGIRDTVGAMATFALGEDTKQISAIGDPFIPTNPWATAAGVAAARASRDNPVFSIRDINLTTVTAPDEGEYLNPDDLDSLSVAGVTTFIYVQGIPRVNRMPTLAKSNDNAAPSEAFYDTETKITVSAYRALRKLLFEAQIGKTFVDDASATEFSIETSRRIIDTEGLVQLMTAQFTDVFLTLAWVSDFDGWLESLVIEKTDANTATYTENPKINGILYFVKGLIAFKR